jgi:deoxycytidine triphosphate deaminase
MYLLNDELIRSYIKKPKGTYLDIHGFDERNLHPTYYYFRLGHHYKMLDRDTGKWETGELDNQNRIIRLEQFGYVLVKSFERFYLSEKVMAIFGQTSGFTKSGLQLVHSPFIDPLFDGHLDLGIWNRMPWTVDLEIGHTIGKVKFFDISDTYPIRDSRGTVSETKLKRRQEFRDDDPNQPWIDSY